jgi:hypothetical protein
VQNPPAAGDVVPKTGLEPVINQKNYAADAAPSDPPTGELVLIPSSLPAVAEITAREVLAAWIDVFRANDASPTKQQIGQVGRESKALLLAGNPPERVLIAARSAAGKGFATVQSEYGRLAARSSGSDLRQATTDMRVRQAAKLIDLYPEEHA